MKSLQTEGVPCVVTKSDKLERKLAYTLDLLGLPSGGWACVNTQLPNDIVAEAIALGSIPKLQGYAQIRREVAYGEEGSRIDILVDMPDRQAYVEVKNVTLLEDSLPYCAQFPDAVTTRGSKHLRELTRMVQRGCDAYIVFLVNRTDCSSFRLADHIDPTYAKAHEHAERAGVQTLVLKTAIEVGTDKAEIRVAGEL